VLNSLAELYFYGLQSEIMKRVYFDFSLTSQYL
jgi:hypothetical protein